jgi:peptidoglycan hydrolase-like protein with peptidoglycan-binding domain
VSGGFYGYRYGLSVLLSLRRLSDRLSRLRRRRLLCPRRMGAEGPGSTRYYQGPIDGVIGKGTRSAIRGYRADYGLPVSSRLDAELL